MRITTKMTVMSQRKMRILFWMNPIFGTRGGRGGKRERGGGGHIVKK